MKGKRPAPVGGIVDGLLNQLGIAERVERATVLNDWAEIVGPGIAERATPVGFNEGTLFVEVMSASWRMELNMMRRDLLRRLNAGKKRGRIEKIVFVQADGTPEGGGPRRTTNGN